MDYLQQQNKRTPQEYVQQLRESYNRLIDCCKETKQPNLYLPWRAPSLQESLRRLSEQDEKEFEQNVKEELVSLSYEEKIDLIKQSKREGIVEKIVEESNNKRLKKECVNAALAYVQMGLGREEKEVSCDLQSWRQRRVGRSLQTNILRPLAMRYPCSQQQQEQQRGLIHMSVFHPFTHKKTQELVMILQIELKELAKEIECVVERLQMREYPDEEFDAPSFSFCVDQNRSIGSVEIEICKQYEYRHLNQCVHWVYVHEIRLSQKGDVNYDALGMKSVNVFEAPRKIKLCEGCGRAAELFRVLDMQVTFESPSFLCKQCDQNLHLDQESKEKYQADKPLPYLYH